MVGCCGLYIFLFVVLIYVGEYIFFYLTKRVLFYGKYTYRPETDGDLFYFILNTKWQKVPYQR